MIWGRDSLERFTKGPRFLDVDDAIWAETPRSPRTMASLAGRVDVVLAGNERIAEWFSNHANDVRIIYTAVDVDLFRPADDDQVPDRSFTIVWTGQKVTLRHLKLAEPALASSCSATPTCASSRSLTSSRHSTSCPPTGSRGTRGPRRWR